MFLYIVPLKQGLKQRLGRSLEKFRTVFIHSSIKTRIETLYSNSEPNISMLFLYIVPLKQGLKLKRRGQSDEFQRRFYT